MKPSRTAQSITNQLDSVTQKRPGWIRTLLHWTWVAVRSFLQFLLIAWATLAIYFSNLPWPQARLALAIVFALFSVWALWVKRRAKWKWVFAGAFLGVVAWFTMIPPSHDRPWRPEVAVMPHAVIDGDRVKIIGVRNFDFRSRHDFTPRYEDREFLMSHVAGLDMYLSYWAVGPVGHTFVSFKFDDGTPPLCISIETRPEVGEGFAPIASMFKQFELIYVVGDEHDLVGSRARHRNEEVFLYPLQVTPEGARELLRFYLKRINELYAQPEWYHLLSNSCTINIIRYANRAGREGQWDIRHLLNGWFDRYLYNSGWVDTNGLSFDEFREKSRITDAAKKADHAPDFWQRIRAGLPHK